MLDSIKQEYTTARKQHNVTAINVLSTLIAECEKIGKDASPPRPPTPDECIAAIKKMVKALNDFVTIVEGRGDHVKHQSLLDELTIITAFLPKQMTHDELTDAITSTIAAFQLTTKRQMGGLMKALKDQHGNTFDSKQAAQIANTILQ
jgi:uncharacterized protein YqeY